MAAPVYVNIYDVMPSVNGCSHWSGLGVYHSAIQVYDVEFAFGGHDDSSTGIYATKPKHCPGFTFRKSILVGTTSMRLIEIRSWIEKMSKKYAGNSYNLLERNCNHFSSELCFKLTGKNIPTWINRLAGLGTLCRCFLPAHWIDTKVKQVKEDDDDEGQVDLVDKEKFTRRNHECSAGDDRLTADQHRRLHGLGLSMRRQVKPAYSDTKRQLAGDNFLNSTTTTSEVIMRRTTSHGHDDRVCTRLKIQPDSKSLMSNSPDTQRTLQLSMSGRTSHDQSHAIKPIIKGTTHESERTHHDVQLLNHKKQDLLTLICKTWRQMSRKHCNSKQPAVSTSSSTTAAATNRRKRCSRRRIYFHSSSSTLNIVCNPPSVSSIGSSPTTIYIVV